MGVKLPFFERVWFVSSRARLCNLASSDQSSPGSVFRSVRSNFSQKAPVGLVLDLILLC